MVKAKRDRSRYIEKRRALLSSPPGSYEEMNDKQKALLDLAALEGSVLLVGRRMGPWLASARGLVTKGVLSREGNFFKPTTLGLALYGARQKK